jgi:hypothetical protein
MHSPGAGGCDFATTIDAKTALWTADALPSVVVLTRLDPGFGHPEFVPRAIALKSVPASDANDRVFERMGAVLRIHLQNGSVQPAAALLPFDDLFDIRVTAALRLWRALKGRDPGSNPAALAPARLARLVLALRALDGRLDGATNREIAKVLFGTDVSKRDWIDHDLRDRTARLVRLGVGMMKGGYRRLLLHPYRGRR